MLASAESLNQQLLHLPPTIDRFGGATQFIEVVGNYLDQVQAGPTGTPGILVYNKSAAVSALLQIGTFLDNSWINPIASAIHVGVTAGTTVPSTVTDPVWDGSGNKDILTSGSPSTTITTLGAAKSVLIGGLGSANYFNNPALPIATAIRNYALAFTFLCTGLNSTFNPTSKSFPAE